MTTSTTEKKDKSYLDLVGQTPMVRVERVLPDQVKKNKVRMLLKLEMQNPGGSVKDRIAKRIIEDAEKSGALKPGMTVVEYTSGNTGIGLAMVCANKGYKFICCMPQAPTFHERYATCRQFGAHVHLTAPAKGMPGLKEYAEQLKQNHPEGTFFFANQFTNESNPTVHYETTGPEIWEQAHHTVDYFVTGVGTGGTATGAGRFLTEQNPNCQVICVEPTESRVHVGQAHTSHGILGIGAGVPTNFLTQLEPDKPFQEGPRGHVAEFCHCSTQQAIDWATKVTQTEGIMLGPTAGAAVKVAMEVAARPEAQGKTIVVLCASHAIRYTQHPQLWGETMKEAKEALPNPPNPSKDIDTLQWKSEDYVEGKSKAGTCSDKDDDNSREHANKKQKTSE
ncbi:Bifunctional L-3-cyanoalanine synthase/cysteine synthase [Seminavis robusta]|uniref:Bifunctional L-3-cyanoalanine synthase/cysteine synthase n=1 Tax=Seminavis robusta TaxID=568900 RepID=A0A9N8DBD9_9STRA|nr:Bifunctional L-3-cyanoalanine synthase/cysteine synthase [Seminavis robusta]|eukprot:Sro75_g041140.1 Bifunctional L-3-cyanoalanine synthase/cysteine synthase (393) ;mRNA; f:48177-49355